MKILGLDLGTNSIGWAVVDKDSSEFTLLQKGVRIFQEGVKIEKGKESSKAAERTKYRSARKLKYRRKLRKINVLKVLVKYQYCPEIPAQELDLWRYKGIYPRNIEFREWLRTDEKGNKTPYYYRNLAVTEKLDLNNAVVRYKIGRAFYHLAQRRGFLSNRLESTKENIGIVKLEISEINKEKGDRTLGQYFYEKYLAGEKIRDTYTHREDHYLAEFNRICEFQKLPQGLCSEMEKAIFYQRPLKSQKGLVGKCVFEKNKPRCPVSRPEFEEFRMLSFINNIKIKMPDDDKLRPLTQAEKQKILPLFFRKSKDYFEFEDIAKNLAPKKQYRYFKDNKKNPEDWLFNYSLKTTVSGCPVSARFIEIFGDQYMLFKTEYLNKTNGGRGIIDINDVWHVLFSFDSDKKLADFARDKLNLSTENSDKFLKIKLKKDYSTLSLKAIKKILPYLRMGLIYSHAVFLAKLDDILPSEIWNNEKNRRIISDAISEIIRGQNEEKSIIDIVNGYIKDNRENNSTWSEEAKEIYRIELNSRIENYYGKKTYSFFPEERKTQIENKAFTLFESQMRRNWGKGDFASIQRIDEQVKAFISDNFNISAQKLEKLYHPSAIDVYDPPKRGADGRLYLGSPMVSSIRNPMAMRSLHQLRKVINELIENDVIDANTRVNVEMARDLKNANERKALKKWQEARETLHREYAGLIKEHFIANGLNIEPSSDDILKYQLWEEQNHKCLYTGSEIKISDFIGSNPAYDIEHTIPRSISLDNSQVNKTLCSNRFNRTVKRNKIPTQLDNHTEILTRVEQWKEKYEDLDKQVHSLTRIVKNAADKEMKDRLIQKRHYLVFERDYWREKYYRFIMEDVSDGFKNSQLVDTGIITKYARLYLKTYFDKVYTVKGNTVADFRKAWGLQSEYEKKERVSHIHHCIDAITIACITKENYELLAKFYHDWEEAEMAGSKSKPKIDMPWPTFTTDILGVEKEVLVSHYTPDNLPKQSKKKLRSRGIIKRNESGQPIFQKGDTVRGALHKETNYGAIKVLINNRHGEKEERIIYAFRKSLDALTASDIQNIVDPHIREIVTVDKTKESEIKKELDKLNKQIKNTEDEHEINRLNSQMNDLQQELSALFHIKNKNGSITPIKKVRCIATNITNPLQIKKHRDLSLHDYKQYSNFENDRNYLIAIYEGANNEGKIKRDFILVNYLEAGQYYCGKLDYEIVPKVHPRSSFPMKQIIRIGTLVLLIENNPDEIDPLSFSDIQKRLYKVIGLSVQRIKSTANKIIEYATIVLRHTSEARLSKELKIQDGIFRMDEPYIAQRKLNQNQFKALVEGFDFTLSATGIIHFKD
jgi:CRISPR-associated endonuclease Csn1